MTRTCRTIFLLAFVGITQVANGAPPSAGIYTLEVPADMKALFAQLKKGDNHIGVIRAIAARDEAEPYVRLELQTATDRRYKQDLTEALSKLEGRTYERNKTYYPAWAEGGRLDLCAELLVMCPEKDDALKLADLTLPLRERVVSKWFREAQLPTPTYYRTFWGAAFELSPSHSQVAGTNLLLPPATATGSSLLIRADRCETQDYSRACCFVAVRTHLQEKLKPPLPQFGQWLNCTVVVNNSFTLTRDEECLIVADGDVAIPHGLSRCVVIANGNIRGTGGRFYTYNALCATGDIIFPGERPKDLAPPNVKRPVSSVYHAGGTIAYEDGQKPDPSDRIRERQSQVPFGVRFLDPSEFRIELAVQNGGIQVMAISAESPFAKYGVEDADIITSVEGVEANSLAVFRRQLRTGIMRGSLILNIRRGNLRLTRIVFLDGIPPALAPAPRPKP